MKRKKIKKMMRTTMPTMEKTMKIDPEEAVLGNREMKEVLSEGSFRIISS